MTSMRRNDVASASFRRHVPTRFLINQCQIIIFLILKSDIIENSRIELRGIVLPVPSNQIEVAFIISPGSKRRKKWSRSTQRITAISLFYQ